MLKANTHNKDIKAMNINTLNRRAIMFKKQKLQKMHREIKT